MRVGIVFHLSSSLLFKCVNKSAYWGINLGQELVWYISLLRTELQEIYLDIILISYWYHIDYMLSTVTTSCFFLVEDNAESARVKSYSTCCAFWLWLPLHSRTSRFHYIIYILYTYYYIYWDWYKSHSCRSSSSSHTYELADWTHWIGLSQGCTRAGHTVP